MTREQIEKAAQAEVEMLLFKEIKCEEINYEHDNYESGREDAISDYGNILFAKGAQWRINSVWHKPSAYGEELTRNVEVVAKTKRGYRFGKFDVVGYSIEYIGFVSTSRLEYALSDVLEYAYLEDLLPERKEETE